MCVCVCVCVCVCMCVYAQLMYYGEMCGCVSGILGNFSIMGKYCGEVPACCPALVSLLMSATTNLLITTPL